MNTKIRNVLIIISIIFLVGYGGYYFYSNSIEIERIELVSPDNSALKEDIIINLSRPANVYVEYWIKDSLKKIRTPVTKKDKKNHKIHLMLLKPEKQYKYKIVIDGLVNIYSETYTFHTRKQSSWLVHNWIKTNRPHDEKAMGKGLIMLCYRGYPGYIAMVDGKGTIRWYWQDELGVRLATITPRNTIIALLAPASTDKFYDEKKEKQEPKGITNYYLRTGKIGFMGGTEIAEIDLQGNVLWRVNIEKKDIIFHHDLLMNKKNQIVSIYRDYKLYDLKGTEPALDTLWGDGIMVMDTTGNVLKKWSAWDVWDISKDKRIKKFANDRFHFNDVSLDKYDNYLISTPIENQIWKVNPNTGKIIWKLGKGGDFKMDSTSYFNFQHASHINQDGDLMLFDNGDFSPNDTTKIGKLSRALSFNLDTINMEATVEISAELSYRYYTSRMGSAYLLPNNNILQTSSKTGTVVITDKNGKVLWELNSHFIPYQAKYVPEETWEDYIR